MMQEPTTHNLEPAKRPRLRTLALWVVGCGLWVVGCGSSASASFVYETETEFLASGRFNADGIPDVLVLDKHTGNARVGFQNADGALMWSAPRATGVENASGCAVGRFLDEQLDSAAVTAPIFNRLHYMRLSGAGESPVSDISPGIGPRTLVALARPFAIPGSAQDHLLVASSFNDPPSERLHVKLFLSGASASAAEFGRFDRPNALQLTTNGPTFAVGLVRGASNDTLRIWQFTNATPGVLATLSNLPPGSDYVFGTFNGEPLPRFWFYVPGQSNVTVRALLASGTGFTFGAPVSVAFTSVVHRVYYVSHGTHGSAMVQFGDGVRGVRLPAGVPQVAAKYSVGGGVTGLVPLSDGRFALLSAPAGIASSVSAQVIAFDGANYTQLSASELSPIANRNTRANVWLFIAEPFVNAEPGLIASVSAPDWSSGVTGLPGAINVRVETDSGTASGLGSPATNNVGAPPQGVNFAVPDQYREDISFFTYAAPKPAEPVGVTINPPPGSYGGPINISFTTVNPTDQVHYRVSPVHTWQTYSAPFLLTNDATIEFYGRQPSTGFRAQLQFASYAMGNAIVPPEPPANLPDSGNTNQPPYVNPNPVYVSANGTVFYGRRSALAETLGLLGPTPYLHFTNSPFHNANFDYFHLEDFEDGAFNTPGATPSVGWMVANPGGSTDSVDPGGRSYYSNGRTNLTVTFNAAVLGGKLPTHAGIVWTDVGNVTSGLFGRGNVIFTARDASGVSLGTVVGVNLGDGSSVASQTEDRFFGVAHPDGISSISITMTNSGDWEIDHVQYGHLGDAAYRGSIWAINLDGSGETFITTGVRPRVSRDGHYMSFVRVNDPAPNRRSLWLRNLITGSERRLRNSSERIVGHDWRPDNSSLIFDDNCFFWSIGLAGEPAQLPLASDCRQAAPAVNPVDGRVAFQVTFPGSIGLYLAPPDMSSRQNLGVNIISPRWPAWSPDGQSLVVANDPSISPALGAGRDLWVVKLGPAQTNVHQITALGANGAFPNGAVWSHDGRGLVGAGRIGGVNGLWVIPLSPDLSTCHCPPRLLPTSPGDDIEFAGSVIGGPVNISYANLGLFIRQEPDAVVVYWSTNYHGFALQATIGVPAAGWSDVSGPYYRAGPYFEFREPRASLSQQKYFRLHYPGELVLVPDLTLSFRVESGNQAVFNWPQNYVGYVLESATNMSPPVLWTPLGDSYVITNGVFEYRKPIPGPHPAEFFRLRGPLQ